MTEVTLYADTPRQYTPLQEMVGWYYTNKTHMYYVNDATLEWMYAEPRERHFRSYLQYTPNYLTMLNRLRS